MAAKTVNDGSNSGSISELVKAVENGKEFLAWRTGNKAAYLSSVFIMVADASQLAGNNARNTSGNEWLVSYYDKKDDSFTTFSSLGTQRAAKEQAFKKGKSLPKLDADAIRVGISKGIEIAEGVRASSYKGEETSRVIAILQPLTQDEILAGNESDSGSKGNSKNKASPAAANSIRPVWNVTYITTAYNVINVKVDAETGKVLSHRLSGVMDFMQKDK